MPRTVRLERVQPYPLLTPGQMEAARRWCRLTREHLALVAEVAPQVVTQIARPEGRPRTRNECRRRVRRALEERGGLVIRRDGTVVVIATGLVIYTPR